MLPPRLRFSASALGLCLLTSLSLVGCVGSSDDDDGEPDNRSGPVQDAGWNDTTDRSADVDSPPPDASTTDPDMDSGDKEDAGASEDTRSMKDASVDTSSSDTGPLEDTGRDGDDTSDVPPCVSSTPKPASDSNELTLDWLVSNTLNNGERVTNAINDGSFRVPGDGQQAYGGRWTKVSPEDDGKIANRRNFRGIRYAAVNLVRFSSDVIYMNPEGIRRVYVNGSPLAGDIYGHGDKRIPVNLGNGTNRVVVQFSTIRNAKVQLFETPDPIVFNKRDKTTPELRVGSKTTQPIGLPVLNTSGRHLRDISAKVVDNQYFEATTLEHPSLPADTLTQIAFRLKPKSKWSTAGQDIPVKLRLNACSLDEAIETTVMLKTVERNSTFRRTFRSPIDGSVQYYGVLPPKNYSPTKKYGVALALHGASVEGEGHTSSYSQKEWAYIVGPTNRRRFGFDWEEWGRFNGLASLDHAMDTFNIDDRRVYVTGHSMGGHGTWHFGVMDPDRFAAIGPSAGWKSFYTYSGTDKPQGPIAAARAHSETDTYLPNLSDRGAYIVHGGADNNVPTQEGRNLRDDLRQHSDDVKYHEEPGADHWWDGDRSPDGTDCVDWPPLFEFFENRKLPEQPELDFEFRSPGPYYSATYDYVTIRARDNPLEDAVLTSDKVNDSRVRLTTQNVQSMAIDGKALQSKGITEINVDGSTQPVQSQEFVVGPQTEKHPGQTGPLNQAFRQPFCFVYPANGSGTYQDYAAFLLSVWSIRGNGHGCAMPKSQVTASLRQERNLIYLGVETSTIPNSSELPFSWDGQTLNIGQSLSYDTGVGYIAFPQGEGMAASIQAAPGSEDLLFSYHPFSSRSGMPDYLVFSDRGGLAFGFFDANWEYNSNFGASR